MKQDGEGKGGVFSIPSATSDVPRPHWGPNLIGTAMSSRPFGKPRGWGGAELTWEGGTRCSRGQEPWQERLEPQILSQTPPLFLPKQQDQDQSIRAKQASKQAHLQDFQHFVCLFLGHDGVVIETAQLALKPKGVDVSGMEIFLLGAHQLTGSHQLGRNTRTRTLSFAKNTPKPKGNTRNRQPFFLKLESTTGNPQLTTFV